MKLKKNTNSSVQTVTPSKSTSETKFVDAKVFVTYHPQSVLLGGFELEEKIIADLARFKQARLRPPKEALPNSEQLGWDVEYDKDGKLLTVGVADTRNAAAFETSEPGYKKKISPIIKKAKVLVGHSVAGDLDYLVRLGLARESWLRGVDVKDSLLLARMQNENGGKGAYGLEALLLSNFNFTPWKAETEKLIKATGNAADWSPEQRIARCRLDAWATAVLAEHFEGKLNESKN